MSNDVTMRWRASKPYWDEERGNFVQRWVADTLMGGNFPADSAPRRLVKSRYACQHPPCEHGPSTGHPIRDGYCKEHRDVE